MLTLTARSIALILIGVLFLTGCTPEVIFEGESLVDDEGAQYGTLSWSVAPSAGGSTVPTKVTIEPYIGEVDFTGSINVQPEETTTYTLRADATTVDGGIWNTISKVTIYIGPRVDYSLFDDVNFRACLEDAGITHIVQVTTLLCYDRDIDNIEGIQQLTGITTALLDLNNITDFSPLGSLSALQTLSFRALTSSTSVAFHRYQPWQIWSFMTIK